MQFTIEINQPVATVFARYTDRDTLTHWQTDVTHQELVNGKRGAVSSRYKLSHKTVTIFETIQAINPPFEIKSEFEHQRNGTTKMFHTATVTFTELTPQTTLLTLVVDQKVIGFIPKIVMRIFAGAVKKHHQKVLANFKAFAEKG
tara:strand:- start:10877 stop:11311 length:435 start_codon:yes stop_codon:yes gene_type:complete